MEKSNAHGQIHGVTGSRKCQILVSYVNFSFKNLSVEEEIWRKPKNLSNYNLISYL